MVQLHMEDMEANLFHRELIHFISKWPSFMYSFVCLQISPCCLVLKLKIQKIIQP